ncbi:hypothetical protein K474DRAFT_1613772 [Panus rudis PR-1116 ss-1]|nr:hypothetical protein K474DRAFT_1613772 [Panus rudis PR-1116 ss-1]
MDANHHNSSIPQSQTEAGPSRPRAPLSISGTHVGLLDPSQRDRILNSPNSILSFATFHPRAAAAWHDGHSLSAREELNNSKRIVIEHLSNGEQFWRWVPRARGVETVEDEGHWPRVIDICGQYVNCSQEQWDIYKLDPAYECIVHRPPKLTTIIRKTNDTHPNSVHGSQATEDSKRRLSSPSAEPEEIPTSSRKKPRTVHVEVISDTDSEDEGEVEDMIVDDERLKRKEQLVKQRRQAREQDRKMRREKNASRKPPAAEGPLVQEISMIDLTQESDSPPDTTNSNTPEPTTGKRGFDDHNGRAKKRLRTHSPNWQDPRNKRGDRHWQDKYRERMRGEKEQRRRNFEASLFSTLPGFENPTHANDSLPYNPYADSQDTPQSTSYPYEDPVSLEEKIRRVTELNEYERARVLKEEERKRAEAEELERRRRLEEQRIRLERERLEREREAERRKKDKENERWRLGPWTTQRALERYRTLSDAFDAAKFTTETVVAFMDIPWPVLLRPTTYSAQDIDWSAVEAFFHGVRMHMHPQEYKTFVEKSHRRFHPDRWRSRRVLQSIPDDEERALIEVAANTVAQAITPLWREVKG